MVSEVRLTVYDVLQAGGGLDAIWCSGLGDVQLLLQRRRLLVFVRLGGDNCLQRRLQPALAPRRHLRNTHQ